MREIRALVWKEWHETRLFLWIALGLFIGLPIIGGVEGRVLFAQAFEFYASPWVMILAPVLAIIVGVATTCRDLQPKLEDFWQSRPLGSVRLFIVKYFVGISVILLACGVPLVVECFSQHNRNLMDLASVWVGLSLLLLPLFSMAFASGCLFHKPAHAAAVVTVGTLLICFLPIVFPPLERFSVDGVLDENALEVAAVSGLLGIAIVMVAFGLLSVRFHWHIESGKPLIYGAICAAFLVLAGSASYQLGTNLPVLSVLDLPADAAADNAVVGQSSTTLYLRRIKGNGHPWQSNERSLTVSNDSLGLGAIDLTKETGHASAHFVISDRDPLVNYSVRWVPSDSVGTSQLLVTWHERPDAPMKMTTVDLWTGPDTRWDADAAGYLYQFRDRLYILGKRLIVFDISDPPHPRQLTNEANDWRLLGGNVDGKLTFLFPPAPGLPSEERRKFLTNIINSSGSMASDGTICLLFQRATFDVFRASLVSDDRVVFALAGHYTPSIIQSMSVGEWFSSRQIQNGLLYTMSRGLLNVFDVSGKGPVKLVAHFASPGLAFCQALPDGRAIAGGDKLWLLGPPPRR